MKFYVRQTNEIMSVINRCYSDADQGRIALGLARLRELGEEFPDNAHIAYAEGQMRRDYLGRGIEAYPFFEAAHGLAVSQGLKTETQWFSTCNLVQLSPNEGDFRRWIQAALTEKGKNQPECMTFASLIEQLDAGVQFCELVSNASQEAYAGEQFGVAAALVEIAVAAWPNIPADAELELRKSRALALRALDRAASQRREATGEAFPADERIALQYAFEEVQRAIALDEYDATLWNFGAAWCVLLKRYEDAVRFADRAISLQPHRYPRPYINKAQALWELQRHQEALACAREGLRQTEASDLPPDVVVQSRSLIEMYGAAPSSPTLDGLTDVIRQIIASARRMSHEELAQYQGGVTLDSVVRRVVNHLPSVKDNPFKGYVPMVADLLACFSPETALCASLEAYKRHNLVAEYCISAALYVAAHAGGAHRKDAARYLCLMTLVLGDPNAVRRYYRQAFLAPSAAAQGQLSQLDSIVREEFGRIHPLFPSLIADQEPATDIERQIAIRDVLSHFEGPPPRAGDAFAAKRGCAGAALFGLLSLITIIALAYWML